jgi:hypothetical protein
VTAGDRKDYSRHRSSSEQAKKHTYTRPLRLSNHFLNTSDFFFGDLKLQARELLARIGHYHLIASLLFANTSMAPFASLALPLSVAFLHLASAALSPITVVGSKFFTSDGDQFYLKGSYWCCESLSTAS